jgi:hypothetical protein
MSIYAVNGKTPVAAWVPSRDDVGNGTTTLTDLVGSNNGTLTNFALSGTTSNWVADTGAGGIRALALDGIDDDVRTPSFTYGTPFSIAAWVNPDNVSGAKMVLAKKTDGITNANQSVQFFINNQVVFFRVFSGVDIFIGRTTGNIITTGWQHIMGVYSGGTSSANLSIFRNGSQVDNADSQLGSFSAWNDANIITTLGSQNVLQAAGAHFSGRMDDLRLFNAVLDSSDAAYLYDGGTGRGRLAPTIFPRRRRSRSGGGVL